MIDTGLLKAERLAASPGAKLKRGQPAQGSRAQRIRCPGRSGGPRIFRQLREEQRLSVETKARSWSLFPLTALLHRRVTLSQ